MSEELKQLVRVRAAAKGWLGRSAKALTTLLDESEVSKLELEDAIDDFDRRLHTLDEAQTAVELTICDTDEMEADIVEADQFRRQVRRIRLQAAQRLADMAPKTVQPGESAKSEHGSADSHVNNAKLPRIELPKFSGNVLEWQSFWEQFEALVEETTIPDISKFGYLLSSLEGEAKRVIQGLSLTASNYSTACSLLKDRFGKPSRVIFSHIQALLNTYMPTKCSGNKYTTSLWKLHDELNAHVRSLESLGVEGKQYGVVLVPVILSRLPHDIRMEWSREGVNHESDVSWLMSFLQKEIERRERSDAYKEGSRSEEQRCGTVSSERRKLHPATASALQSTSSTGTVRCTFCNKAHPSEKCFGVLKLSRAEREEKIRSADLCFRCLLKGHLSKGCKMKCSKCKGNHNVLLCQTDVPLVPKDTKACNEFEQLTCSDKRDKQVINSEAGIDTPVTHVGVTLSRPDFKPKELNLLNCVLQTAKVKVHTGKGHTVTATVLFDSGSDRSYVSRNLVRKVKPKWVCSEPVTYSAFGSKTPKDHLSNLFDLTLMGCNDVAHSLVAVEIPTICAPLLRSGVPRDKLAGFKSLHFADDYMNNRQVTVDILVGMDAYWKFVLPNRVLQVEGLVAQESVFGWILSGSWKVSANQTRVSTQLLCIANDVNESLLHKFWDLESIGICSVEASCDANTCNLTQERFERDVRFCDGRYEVALPWKSDTAKYDLQNNVKIARKRLNNLCSRFSKDPCLKNAYDSVFVEYEQEGICEEVPPSELESPRPTYYLPHRPVVRESHSSTKVRPVFDASAPSYNGISLNDCLETGPSLNPDLVATLLRFRRWPIALTADITKAFLQISVRKEDRDVHRFLWKPEENIRVMRFTRVPFGNKSSPFLLNATIKHHLDLCPQSEVVEELRENLYVDDWLTGAESIIEGQTKFAEASSILSKAGMKLSKWTSNSEYLMEKFSNNLTLEFEKETHKILGLQWIMVNDSFSFKSLSLDFPVDVTTTKRAVLSCIARIFDPLGFITPFTMLVKILFQDVWRLGTGWDDLLPDEMLLRFQKWFKGVTAFQLWSVNRCYFPGTSWRDKTGVELHGFGDASERAYGACVYLRLPLPNGNFQVSLVMSKGRVAPNKSMSLPRLELMSAVLCCRLVKFVLSALHLEVPVFCWTDSTITLSWIKGEPHRWKTFVRNRVVEIQDSVSPDKWFHCPGRNNPADLISRGVMAEQLVSAGQWLNGPAWLSLPLTNTSQEVHTEDCDNMEVVSCVSVNTPSVAFEFTRWSSFCKALNVVAWTMRFITNCKTKEKKYSGPLTYEELTKAKLKLLFVAQREAYAREIETLRLRRPLSKGTFLRKLDPFLDDDGLLRVKGRLDQADMTYENRHPIIVPHGHIAKLLVQFQHQVLKHAGVSTLLATLRNNYWIIGLRKIAKSVCRMCIPCRRHDSKACTQPVAPLPKLRIRPAPPFSVTGLDFAGPLYCTDLPSKKFYILLFTCAVIRAIHLELTESLSLNDCIFAIRRFAARRGLPSVIYSDNAKTFIAVTHRLQENFGPLAPEWKFIVPRAPWWGGWWERLIRSVKSSLRKTFGVKRLSRSELETTLCEVEACVNSRPLTFVGDEPDATPPLTPSHFLIGRTAGVLVEDVKDQGISESAKDLCIREQVRLGQLDKFWRMWTKDYIRNLPPAVKGFVPNCNIKKGSLVLVKEDNVPRMSWPLGIIEEVFPSYDGIIRSVNVKTSKGVFCRPVQRLHDLEISDSVNVIDEITEMKPDGQRDDIVTDMYTDVTVPTGNTSSKVSYTRSGRAVKKPVRLVM